MKKRMSWWALPAIAGSAFIVAAVMLLVVTDGGRTPTASAQEGCVLTLTKTANPSDTVAPGGTITYTLTLSSTGSTEDCDDATVTDTLGGNTTFVSASGGNVTATHSGGTVTWANLDMTGGTWTLTLHVDVSDTADNGYVITNSASATAGEDADVGDATDITASVTVEACELSITKDADNDEVNAGDEIDYDITVTNTGDASCRDIDVTDDLNDTNLTCVSASVNDGDGLNFDQDDIDNSCTDNNVEWQSTSGVLDPGDSINLELDAQTDADLNSGDHVTNEACVTARRSTEDDQEVGQVCATRRTRIEEEATATPTATSTPIPPAPTPVIIIVPTTPVPVPTAAPLPALKAPPSGTGSGSGGTSWALPIGLGIGGLALVAISGGAIVKKRLH